MKRCVKSVHVCIFTDDGLFEERRLSLQSNIFLFITETSQFLINNICLFIGDCNEKLTLSIPVSAALLVRRNGC